MKILCTADWHIGKKLGAYSRFEEQIAVLDEICAISERELPEAVLIAGDCFDTAAPSPEHIRLFVRTLARLTRGGACPVLAIAGNHDSPLLLSSTEAFASQVGVLVLGRPQDTPLLENAHPDWQVEFCNPGVVQIGFKKAGQSVRFLLAPYADARRLKKDLGSSDEGAKAWEIFKAQWVQNLDPKVPTVLAAHHYFHPEKSEDLYAQPAPEEDEGEKKIAGVGGINAVPLGEIPEGIDFVVLGHIHRPQDLYSSKTTAFYAGSPLVYSLSETGQEKSVALIQLGAKKSLGKIPLSPAADVKRLTLVTMDGAEELLRRESAHYVELVWAGDRYLEGHERRLLEEAHPRILSIVSAERLDGAPLQGEVQSPLELFKEYFSSRHGGREPSENLCGLFQGLISEAPESSLPKKRGFLPISLALEGFYSYKERAFVDFEPLEGLFGVFGAVGSGKSALIEAMIFALYRRTQRLGSLQQKSKGNLFPTGYNMMNLESSSMEVEFIFQILGQKGMENYRILLNAKRGKKAEESLPVSRQVYRREEGEWIPLSEDESKGEDLMGLSYEDFRCTVILQQRDFMAFLDADPSENTKTLKRLFNLDRFDLSEGASRNEALIKGELRDVETLLQALETSKEEDILPLEQSILSLSAGLESSRLALAELRTQSERLIRLKEQSLRRQNLEAKISQTQDALDQARSRTEAFLPRQEPLARQKAQTLAALSAINTRSKELFALLDAESPSAQMELQDLGGRIARIEKSLAEEQSQRRSIGFFNSLGELQNLGHTLSRELKGLQALSPLAGLTLRAGEPCPLCGSTEHPSPCDFQQTEEIPALERRIGELKEAYIHIKKGEEFCAKELRGQSLEDLKTAHSALRAEVEAQKAKAQSLKDEKQQIDGQKESLDAALGALQKEETNIEREMAREETAMELHQNILQALQTELSSLPPADETALQRAEAIEGQLREAESHWEELIKKQSEAKQACDLLKKQLAEKKDLLARREACRKRHDEAADLTSLFRGGGFVKYIGQKYLTSLCHSANRRFSAFTGGRFLLAAPEDSEHGISLVDAFNGGQRRDLSTLSGGQSFQAALALSAALAEQSGAGGRFFFIDEGFGALDEANLEAVMDTLSAMAREDGRLIGLISHVGLLHESLPGFFQISSDKNGSRIEVSG